MRSLALLVLWCSLLVARPMVAAEARVTLADGSVLRGQLHLTIPLQPRGMRLPIDTLFCSLAREQGDRAIGVVLSGMGSDGTVGLQAIKAQGGLAAMGQRNRDKAARLYAAIDGSGFYSNPVDRHCRSIMNVPFILANPELDGQFLKESQAAGLTNLAGHRSVGGMRASIYNAMPPEGVDALIAFMREFERRHG